MELSSRTELAARCRAVADEIESGPLQEMIQRANDAVRIIERSFSGSWIGYHAHVYYPNFQSPPPGDQFSPEWGLQKTFFGEGTSQNWREVPYEQAEAAHEEGFHHPGK
uniref:Uncharacterized protein n=1 Tax=Candidatus Kentrum sp. LFY TaxID=2126342 RepID=A0A450UST2_9GAMM|nr:MAG: hypothetical protein BECKLFY1418A_GA0070994_105127 [Candidatus Kentron sp. LFY]